LYHYINALGYVTDIITLVAAIEDGEIDEGELLNLGLMAMEYILRAVAVVCPIAAPALLVAAEIISIAQIAIDVKVVFNKYSDI